MATTIETDLKEILEKIDSRLERLEQNMTDLKIGQARVEEKLSGQISALDEKLSGQINVLDEKVTGLANRVEFQEFLNRSFIVGIGIAVLTGLAKILGFLPNP